jgi:5-methylcytosine-specific restriction endonuclease McrA
VRRYKRRAALLRLQGGACFYCGEPMSTTAADPLRMDTFDEVVPRSRGGMAIRTNVVLACMGCNRDKGNRMPTAEELDRLHQLLARDTIHQQSDYLEHWGDDDYSEAQS